MTYSAFQFVKLHFRITATEEEVEQVCTGMIERLIQEFNLSRDTMVQADEKIIL